MKRLIIILLNLICFSLYSFAEEARVEITADVLQPITMNKISDIDFGSIIAGSSNIVASKDGRISIRGNGNVKLQWKSNEDSKFKSVKENLIVPIYNKNSNKIMTEIYLEKNKNLNNGEILKLSGNKEEEIGIKGRIEKLPLETEEGEYSGSFTMRVSYID